MDMTSTQVERRKKRRENQRLQPEDVNGVAVDESGRVVLRGDFLGKRRSNGATIRNNHTGLTLLYSCNQAVQRAGTIAWSKVPRELHNHCTSIPPSVVEADDPLKTNQLRYCTCIFKPPLHSRPVLLHIYER